MYLVMFLLIFEQLPMAITSTACKTQVLLATTTGIRACLQLEQIKREVVVSPTKDSFFPL
ncbi:hypothetical protein NC651_037571 [Populus alba x Populus x berolinensis]|nr:hypothetical protein NC651_037571 [Populus alba x Populus x berolinensis]